MKLNWKPGTMLYPLPAVLVSCACEGKDNLITVAWTGTICTDPAMLYISVRPERYSYNLIRQSGEFTVNLTTAAIARATDLCGVTSGRDCDKWEKANLHRVPGVAVSCPSVEEAPISLECKVVKVLELGSHHMFLAEVLNVRVDDKYLDEQERFSLEKAGLLNYSHGHYYCQGRPLGHFGFSVRRKPLKNK